MTKDYFLTMLDLHLSDGGMPKTEVDKRIAYFNKYFTNMSAEDIEKKIIELGGDKGVAKLMLAQYRKNEEDKAESEESAEFDDSDEGDDDDDDMIIAGRSKKSTLEQTEDNQKNEQKKKSIMDLLDDDDEEEFGEDESHTKEEKKSPVKQKHPAHTQKDAKKKKPVQKNAAKGKALSQKSKTTFTVGLIILSPLLLFAAVLLVAFFAVMYGGLAFVVGGAAVVLLVLTAGGTAVALFAVIYGITQLSTSAGAGLYEIGLGIIIAGVTMLVGILLYNFIVRLSPFIYKKIWIFTKFTAKKLVLLYNNVKGACEKL